MSGELRAPAPLPAGKRAPGSHWTGDWVGSRADLDDVERRKILPLTGLELDFSAVQPYPVAIPTELSRLFIYMYNRIMQWWSWTPEITQFWVTIVTNFQEVISYINASYVTDNEREISFLFQCIVSVLQVINLIQCKYEKYKKKVVPVLN
jgi:hypothetical protein